MKRLLHKESNFKSKWVVLILLIIGAFIILAGRGWRLAEIHSTLAREVTAKVEELKSENKSLEAQIPQTHIPTQKEIEDYVKVIFGKNAKVAIAVSHHECNPKNKQYPKCVALSDKEYSIGVFQINLKNKTHLIHASKVPGKTLEEKAEKLKDPYINTLVAYKIFSDSGFNPWTAYTNESYKQSLAER